MQEGRCFGHYDVISTSYDDVPPRVGYQRKHFLYDPLLLSLRCRYQVLLTTKPFPEHIYTYNSTTISIPEFPSRDTSVILLFDKCLQKVTKRIHKVKRIPFK